MSITPEHVAHEVTAVAAALTGRRFSREDESEPLDRDEAVDFRGTSTTVGKLSEVLYFYLEECDTSVLCRAIRANQEIRFMLGVGLDVASATMGRGKGFDSLIGKGDGAESVLVAMVMADSKSHGELGPQGRGGGELGGLTS